MNRQWRRIYSKNRRRPRGQQQFDFVECEACYQAMLLARQSRQVSVFVQQKRDIGRLTWREVLAALRQVAPEHEGGGVVGIRSGVRNRRRA
jgi:hypothetical protein